jgi:hypothetical protein
MIAAVPSKAVITLTWDDPSPVFVRPDVPFTFTYGNIVGTVTVDPGEELTHYSFSPAFNTFGESPGVGFSPLFAGFTTGTYHGPILQYTIFHETRLGVYDLSPFDVFYPYLQLKDLLHGAESEKARYSFTVVERGPGGGGGNGVPEPGAVALVSAACVGASLLRRRRRF